MHQGTIQTFVGEVLQFEILDWHGKARLIGSHLRIALGSAFHEPIKGFGPVAAVCNVSAAAVRCRTDRLSGWAQQLRARRAGGVAGRLPVCQAG